MQAGKLNRRVIVQTPSKSYDSGEQVETWITLGTVYANIKPVVSNEFEKSGVRFQADTHYEIRVRYHHLIKPEDRLLLNDDIYHVFGIIHTDESLKETVLYCKKSI